VPQLPPPLLRRRLERQRGELAPQVEEPLRKEKEEEGGGKRRKVGALVTLLQEELKKAARLPTTRITT